jgi:putative membrane protein
MMWWNNGTGYGMGAGGWVLMTLVMLAFWGLVIVAGVALFRRRREDHNPPQEVSAHKILDERFARGEIDAEEYRARKDGLGTRR